MAPVLDRDRLQRGRVLLPKSALLFDGDGCWRSACDRQLHRFPKPPCRNTSGGLTWCVTDEPTNRFPGIDDRDGASKQGVSQQTSQKIV